MKNNKSTSPRIKRMTDLVNKSEGEEETGKPVTRSTSYDTDLSGSPQANGSNSPTLMSNAKVLKLYRDYEERDDDDASDASLSSKKAAEPKKRTERVAKSMRHDRNSSATRTTAADRTYSEIRAARQKSGAAAAKASRKSAGSTKNISDTSRDFGKVNYPENSYTESGYSERSYSDRSYSKGSYPQRGQRKASSRSGQKARGKKKMSGFKKGVLIYSAALLVILIVGFIVFLAFLSSYEKYQPYNRASEIIENYSTSDTLRAFLNEQVAETTYFDDTDIIIDSYVSFADGKTVSYVENDDYRDDAPSYDIVSEDETIAKMTFESTSRGAFGLRQWSLSKFVFADYIPNTFSYDVIVPNGSSVEINGKALDASFVTGEGIPEELSTASTIVSDIPSYTTYHITGLIGTPEVSGTDSAGNILSFTPAEGQFVASGVASENFISGIDWYVRDAVEAWGLYFIHMDSSLSSYIYSDCDLYAYIFGSDEMDPILTWLYNYEDIASYSFNDTIQAINYVVYSDNCFTVDVSYQLSVSFVNEGESDDNQTLDAAWVFIKDAGGSWKICEMVYH